jgi:tetratricopeptide (TPR) repeat protein
LVVNPKCARCYLNIGKVYSSRGDNKTALQYFDKAISIDPKNALLYSYRGRLKEILGDKLGALPIKHNIDVSSHAGVRQKFGQLFSLIKN